MRYGRTPFIIGFLTVPMILYLGLVIWPYIQAFQISMTNWSGLTAEIEFVGLRNFMRLMADQDFVSAVKHNLALLLLLPAITIAIALFFSFLLNVGGTGRGIGGIWGSRFYKIVFFFPQILAVAILGALFAQVFREDDSGMISAPMVAIGLDPINFLSSENIAFWTVLGVMVWQAVGFYVVLFSAGMASIPSDIYEAAQLDGASRTQLFFKVTLPLLWDTVQVAWVYIGIIALDAFAIVWVMTVDRGGPNHSTTVIAVEIYRNAFEFAKFGLASAMGVVLFFLSITFAALMLRFTRRERIEF